jgi:hypothetical protein
VRIAENATSASRSQAVSGVGGTMAGMRKYDVISLQRAWAAIESPSAEVPPTAEQRQRFDAMQVAFGAEGSRESTTLWVLSGTVGWFDHQLRSPFDGMMEAPRGIIELYQKYGNELAERVDGLSQLVEDMLREGAARAFGIDPLATIDDDELREAGFDPGPEPAPAIDD